MLKLQAVTKSYPGKNGNPVLALRDINLQVETGEFVTIIGHSGSGKSTLLFTIGAMLNPTEGTVRLDDTNIYDLSPGGRAKLRLKRIGFMFQTFNLVPYLSCQENVALPGVLAGMSRRTCLEKAQQMLDRLGMAERLRHRPAELSVGERQRVALCRSLINGPALLLADEPTGNLDGERTEDVCQLLCDLNQQGQTIIMVTHDEQLAERGSRVLRLNAGSIEGDRQTRSLTAASVEDAAEVVADCCQPAGVSE
jgi:putative ABC transport system ATP-binding protein